MNSETGISASDAIKSPIKEKILIMKIRLVNN
jgi:hypothetical protein